MTDVEDLALAERAARLGGRTAASFFRRPLDITMKTGPADLVSEADVAAERAVATLLSRHRQQDGLLGEEGSERRGERRWLIDAIDGTSNFLAGDPYWCTAVALEDGDGALVSAIYHPATDEMFSAARGGGASCNGQPLVLATSGELAHAVLATYLHPGNIALPGLQAVARAVASLRVRGSGSLDLAWLAAGRVDLWLQRDVQPWDWVPGALLVDEAGGVTDVVVDPSGEWALAGNRLGATGLRELLHDVPAPAPDPRRSPTATRPA